MNVVDAVVTKVLSAPRFNDKYAEDGVTWWEIDVEYDCYGRISTRTLTFKARNEADEVKVGYQFLT
ncbi:hypothetical protein [Brevibacillus borstelensis]|uniref:hypothetical protein n=1 Tax=Brevibacillus borstelensis TaxID=45462 RepID=UPI00287F851E|nr:hypothetical protein [Brevibacillus borstelensis]WNF07432.1 hypothetical protein RFB14_08495 [Brevibacillus borstelensis]